MKGKISFGGMGHSPSDFRITGKSIGRKAAGGIHKEERRANPAVLEYTVQPPPSARIYRLRRFARIQFQLRKICKITPAAMRIPIVLWV
jgi:hypothetical protein